MIKRLQPQLPALNEDGSASWPNALVLLASGRLLRRGDRPPPQYRLVGRQCDPLGYRDAFIFAHRLVWPFLRAAHWWKDGYVKWAMVPPRSVWLVVLLRCGIMTMREDDYLSDARLASPKRWFRGSGITPGQS